MSETVSTKTNALLEARTNALLESLQELIDENERQRDLLMKVADFYAELGLIPNTPAAKLAWELSEREEYARSIAAQKEARAHLVVIDDARRR